MASLAPARAGFAQRWVGTPAVSFRLPNSTVAPMPTASEQLEPFVDRAGDLYSLPAVALEVLDLTSQSKVDVRALKACIENDPALTVRILRVVNSSLFGLSRQVSDLNQALALLGIKPLKLLVLGFSLSEALFSKLAGAAVSRYWRHTLTKAIAAREISQTLWRLPGDEAFVAGLLQDVGQLVLIQELGRPYLTLLDRVTDLQADVLACERSSLGFDHRQLSAELIERWGLPESLVKVVDATRRGESPPELPPSEQALADVLQVAELVADLVVDARYETLRELLDRSAPRHRLTEDQLAALVGRLNDHVRELADVLSVELPEGVDYRDVLAAAQRRMSSLSVDLLGELARAADPEDAAQRQVVEELRGLTAAMDAFLRRGPSPERLYEAAQPRQSAPRGAAHQREAPAGALPLGLDSPLHAALSAAISFCRQGRCALSLLLVEIDRFDQTSALLGPVEAEQRVERLRRACGRLDLPHAVFLPVRSACMAVVLPDYDRSQAAQLGNQLVRTATHYLASPHGETPHSGTVSVGVATVGLPPKNCRPEELVDAALRCLSAAELSGGNTLKSIGVY